jgi:transposase-like protein
MEIGVEVTSGQETMMTAAPRVVIGMKTQATLMVVVRMEITMAATLIVMIGMEATSSHEAMRMKTAMRAPAILNQIPRKVGV